MTEKPEGCSCDSYPHTCHPKAEQPTDATLPTQAMIEARKMWVLAAATLDRDVLLHGLTGDEQDVMIGAVLNAFVRNKTRHDFWGAGEPDCPREIKAGNGELRTLRCKVCGEDNPRDDRCLGMQAAAPTPNGEGVVKHMTQRFLSWRLPDNFRPDAGISFMPVVNPGSAYEYRHQPTGTNLFDADQAEAMVRHMLEGLPATPINSEGLTPAHYCGVEKCPPECEGLDALVEKAAKAIADRRGSKVVQHFHRADARAALEAVRAGDGR